MLQSKAYFAHTMFAKRFCFTKTIITFTANIVFATKYYFCRKNREININTYIYGKEKCYYAIQNIGFLTLQ